MKKIFKQTLAIMLAVVMTVGAAPLAGFVGLELPEFNLFGTKAEAATSGTCGENLTWTLDETTGELVISGTGAMNDYSTSSYSPWYSYRASIKTVNIADSVTSIGDWAFIDCTGLTSITIPDSVTSIGELAFYDCTSLTNVYYTGDIAGWCTISFETDLFNPMYYADNLYIGGKAIEGDVVIPDGIKIIPDYTFKNCTSLISITIPDNVTRIGRGAFKGCTSLESITLPFVGDKRGGSGTSKDLFGYIFDYTSSSETGTTRQWYAPYMYDSAYYYIPSSLKTVVITDEPEIPFGAFNQCSNLTSITIPDSVTSIGDWAFSRCDSLESITIGNRVTSIGDLAFSGCTSLTSAYYSGTQEDWNKITIGSSNSYLTYNVIFESDSERPYYGSGSCGDNLKWKLYSDGKLEIIGTGEMAEYTSSSSAPWYSKLYSIKSVSLPDGLTSIGGYAFCGCTNLTSVTIPDSVTSVGNYVFSGCTGFTSITIPDSVTNIGDYAFSGCTGITSITVPSGVTSISSATFSGLSNIEKITFEGYDVSIAAAAFDGCNVNLVLYCKSGSSVQSYSEQNGIAYVLTDGSTSDCVIQNNVLVSYEGDSATPDIPNSVTSIGANAFKNNSSVESVEIPYSVTSIFSGAFANCTSLERVIIPHTVTTIAANAFDSTDATIVCFANSYVHEYAVANGIDFELISVHLNETQVVLVIGQNSTIIATPVQNYVSDVDVTWEIENENVATVSDDGTVTALANGTTSLFALAPNGEKLATCSITVTDSASDIPDEPEVPDEPDTPTEPVLDKNFIATPSTTTISYGDAIILHVDASKIPIGGRVEWTTDNGNFSKSVSADGTTCTISPSKSGDTIFTATVYDAEGNAILKDEQTMTSKAGFFDKFAAFFRKLFGMTKIIQQSLNTIY